MGANPLGFLIAAKMGEELILRGNFLFPPQEKKKALKKIFFILKRDFTGRGFGNRGLKLILVRGAGLFCLSGGKISMDILKRKLKFSFI